MAPIVIPASLWGEAQEQLQREHQKRTNTSAKRKKGMEYSFLIRNFAFNLQTHTFMDCSVQSSSNMFFEYGAAAGEEVSRDYIVVQTKDDDSDYRMDDDEECDKIYQYQNDHKRESVLRSGVLGDADYDCEDDASESADIFHFIGCSNSQVQQHSYVFRRAKSFFDNERHLLRALPTLEFLAKKKGVPKRVKYAGLMFSGVRVVSIPKDTIVECIESFENDVFDFTDGPGLISAKLAKTISRQLNIGKYPSIFQIRFCGRVHSRKDEGIAEEEDGWICKGILVVDPRNDTTNTIQVRKSMLKVECSSDVCDLLQNKLGICESSRPIPGRLGQQLICLLSGVVDDQVFFDLQREHFNHLRGALKDPFDMAWVLAIDRNPHPWKCFRKLLEQQSQKASSKANYIKCSEAVLQERLCPKSKKVQIPLASSRTLFGAVFPEMLHGELEEGECVVLLEDGPLQIEATTSEALVIVSRSPSYYPGDVRALRVKTLDTNHPVAQLRNCILFSTRGSRPEADKMGGGDLDGDMYLVIWHPKLTQFADKLRLLEPASYDVSPPKRGLDAPPLANDWVHYAAMTDNIMLAEVENSFYKLAENFGVGSLQVKRLNCLFSSLVDRNPASIDEFKELKGSIAGCPPSSKSVWQSMLAAQTELAQQREKMRRLLPPALPWEDFQCSLSRYATEPLTLKNMFLRSRWHFESSLRAVDFRETVKLLDTLSADQHTTPEDAKFTNIDRSKSDCGDGRVTASEQRVFDALTNKANNIFGKSLRIISKAKKQAELHQSQRAKLESDLAAQKECFENIMMTIADKKILQASWEWKDTTIKCIASIVRLEQKYKCKEVALEEVSNRLKKVESNTWWGFFTGHNSICEKQKEELLAEKNIVEKELLAIKNEQYELKAKAEHEVKSQFDCKMQEINRCILVEEIKLNEEEKKVERLLGEKESASMGLQNVLCNVEEASHKWEKFIASGCDKAIRKVEWKTLVDALQRCYEMEVNRLLGRLDSNGKRKGPMPVYQKRAELSRHMSNAQVVVVTAGTGCGKSTQIAQYVADDFHLLRWTSDRKSNAAKPIRICCTQPRRVATQKIAERVADEYKTKVGDLVGFRVGSRGRSASESKKVSDKTIIEFVTEGLLLFNLSHSKDAVLRYDCIIVDEAHERNAEQDLLLSLLRERLVEAKTERAQFKLLVMSASIDPKKFSSFFFDCPVLNCPGKIFPVTEFYKQMTSTENGQGVESMTGTETGKVVEHALHVLFHDIVENEASEVGDVLIFLSGAKDIDACVAAIRLRASRSESTVVAYPLYAKLDNEQIANATSPSHRSGIPDGTKKPQKAKSNEQVWKVICCTNMAETSLTIDGVRYVIDSGLVKKVSYDHSLRCPVLMEEHISRASAKQRKGRAGRTESGWCYYLYSENFHLKKMSSYDRPKILDEPVDDLILFLLNEQVFGKSIEEINLLDKPGIADIKAAKKRLMDLGFICEDGSVGIELTNDGKVASALSSVKPEAVRMILNCCNKYPQCLNNAIRLAVIMSQEDNIESNNSQSTEHIIQSHEYGDHLQALKNFEWFEQQVKHGKKSSKNKLKKKCATRGLELHLLENIQEGVNKCHLVLKQRGLLPSESKMSCIAPTDLPSRECLLRILISGFFHKLSQCMDMNYMDRIGFSHLMNSNQILYLDRNSCLQKAISNANHTLRHRLGEVQAETGRDNLLADGSDSVIQQKAVPWDVTKEALEPSYLLFGRLFRPGGSQKVFMMDASAIEGHWITEEVPRPWLERVKFNQSKTSLCRLTLRHVSHQILIACNKSPKDFFKQVHEASEAFVVTDYRNCLVCIGGKQSEVDCARTKVENKILEIVKSFKQNDIAENKKMGIKFWPGLRIKSHNKKFHAVGTADTKFYISSGSVLIRKQDHSSIYVSPMQGLSPFVVKDCLDRVKESVSYQFNIKKKSDVFLIDGFKTERANSIVGMLKERNEFSTKCVKWDMFSDDNACSRALCRAIGMEAYNQSPFWTIFYNHVLSCRQSLVADFCSSHSQEAFKFVGRDAEKLEQLLRSSISRFVSSSDMHSITMKGDSQCEVAQFIAILREMKHQCPSVLFVVKVETTDCSGSKIITYVHDIYSEHDSFNSVLRGNGVLKLQYAAFSMKDRKTASALLTQRLGAGWLQVDDRGSLATDKQDCNVKHCVTCKRKVCILGRNSKAKANDIVGWTLTLCGCAFCRECFMISITDSLASCNSAVCIFCDRIVLARDCSRIILAKKSAEFLKEWDHVCRLAESNHCEHNSQMLLTGTKGGLAQNRPAGWFSCPDCRTAMVYQRGWLFFYCRNAKCPNRICTRCCRVVTSEEQLKKCADTRKSHCHAGERDRQHTWDRFGGKPPQKMSSQNNSAREPPAGSKLSHGLSGALRKSMDNENKSDKEVPIRENSDTSKYQWDARERIQQHPWGTFGDVSSKKSSWQNDSAGPHAGSKPSHGGTGTSRKGQRKSSSSHHNHHNHQQQQKQPNTAKTADICGYYRALGLTHTASSAQIKKAYHLKLLEYHPDKNSEEDALDMYHHVRAAFRVLGDEQRRISYDAR